MAKKILIAEDEASILVSLEFLMRKAGYEVRSVTRGDQVLPSLREFVPDLILLDVMLPKRNGFELCHDIRANTEWSQIRILMLSAKQESVRQLIGQAG
jgi:two-component system, OmpR family, alkaline phosphatase synthesis response regulator PhoP